MNRRDYAAFIALRDTARMDRGFTHAPAVAMPRKRKESRLSRFLSFFGA